MNGTFQEKAFRDHLGSFIEDWPAFWESLHHRKLKGFRITASRKVDYEAELDGQMDYSPVPDIKSFYVAEHNYDFLAGSLSFQTGGIYIQNPSSLLPVQILSDHVLPDSLLLDMSAAPGGKTCALSDLTRRSGLIVANDVSRSRLKALNFNLERCGAWNVKTLLQDGRILYKYFADTFDGVLLDAPCSHENQIGYNKKVQARWSPDYVAEMAALQEKLILSAFDCLKPGGMLVYSTCTFSVQENENIIAFLMDHRREAEIVPLWDKYTFSGATPGLSGNLKIDKNVLRILPHHSKWEGFFTAAVRKKGESSNTRTSKTFISREDREFLKRHFDEFPEDVKIMPVGNQIYLESPVELPAPFQRTGMVLGKRFGRQVEISSQAVWEFGASLKEKLRVNVGYEISLDYLKGFDTPNTYEYDGFVFYYKNIPVGVNKRVGDTFKNKLDRYFLYGKTIEW